MDYYNSETWILITRVLSNEATPAEKEKLLQWLKKDPKRVEFYRELYSAWKNEPDRNSVDGAFLFDYESGLNKLRNKLQQDAQSEYKIRYSKPVTPPTASYKTLRWKIAASVLLLVISVSVYAGIKYWEPSYATYATTNIEQRIINLPDGSKVRLNKDSSINFPKDFAGKTREVTLKGEAFFEVVHNSERPFIVHTGDAEVRDIGTSFNIKAGKIVAVQEGIVSLQNNNNSKQKAVILKKGQIGVLTKDAGIKVKHIDVKNYMSWINGSLVFKKMPIKKVFSQLEDIYNIHSRLREPSLSSLTLTAYTKKISLHEVLDMIALSLKLDYRKKGDTITWMRKKNS